MKKNEKKKKGTKKRWSMLAGRIVMFWWSRFPSVLYIPQRNGHQKGAFCDNNHCSNVTNIITAPTRLLLI